MSQSRYAQLSRQELAILVPELLLIGHMIDRSGMAWCIQEFGRDEMVQIAIEEWAGASPIYTKRMQRALNYEGVDVPTIFKGLQLDIGAPPQFMDFRYTIHDRWHGEFQLDHCGALLDVEPMGDEYVFGMCHTIEDPTFDATAVATNPRAQMRPIHRPPRVPSDRHPHCAWTVVIDESYPPAESIPALDIVRETRAATWELDAIDPSDEGLADYSGPLVSDFDFGAYSHSALVRMADEVCLQMHLLYLSFAVAVRARAGADTALADSVGTRQLTGLAGLGAERIHRALSLPERDRRCAKGFRVAPVVQSAGLRQRRDEQPECRFTGRRPTTTPPGSRCAHRNRSSRYKRSPPRSTRTSTSRSVGTAPTGSLSCPRLTLPQRSCRRFRSPKSAAGLRLSSSRGDRCR